MGGVFGFKLHGIVNNAQMLCRFAIVPANEADVTVARALVNPECDELDRILADKATMPVSDLARQVRFEIKKVHFMVKRRMLRMGVFTPPKKNATNPMPWTKLMDSARKLVETVFSSLSRGHYLALGQLNSFWSVRASVCRKIAAHNLQIWLRL